MLVAAEASASALAPERVEAQELVEAVAQVEAQELVEAPAAVQAQAQDAASVLAHQPARRQCPHKHHQAIQLG